MMGHQGQEVLQEYEAWLRSWGASRSTISARTTLARSRLKAWGIAGFTTEQIQAFLATDVRGEPRAKWTMATYHNHLTEFCAFLVATGRLDHSPMDDVRRTKRPKKQPRPLTDRDVTRILTATEGQTRDWLVIALLSGLRAHEIAKLRGEDVTEEGIFVSGKGGVEATLPCHPDIWDMAQRYPRAGFWFPGPDDGHIRAGQISVVTGRLFTAMGIEGAIHRCRHTYCTRLIRAGVNLRQVQVLMRHASLETTAGYAAIVNEEGRDAILRLPPLTPGAA